MRSIYVDKDIPRILATGVLKPVWPGVVFSRVAPAHFAELPEPPLPGPKWVRVRNIQCGICASDLSLLTVSADPRIAPAALPGLQRFYLGHEVVGVIAEAGPGVSRVRVGDRVIMDVDGRNCISQEIDPPCPQCRLGNLVLCENSSVGRGPEGVGGGWSDSYTAHESAVYPAPSDIDDDHATLVEPLSVGLHAALRRPPGPGQKVLVLGSGTIGLCTLQSVRAVAPTSHITAVARHPQQVSLALRFGADEVVTGRDIYTATTRITGAKLYRGMFGNRMLLGGFDLIYDCVGSDRTIRDSLRCARAGGAVVVVGISLRPLKVDLSPIWSQEVELVGSMSHGHDMWQGADRHDYDLVIEFLRAGKLTSAGFITHRFPLDRWREAVDAAKDKRSGAIKVVIDHRDQERN